MVRKELKSILSEQSTSSSSTSSLSPGAQKALEQSKIAKQNKDVQKKRAAAKESMKGMSVEGVELDIEEQFSRMPGDKLQSDEGDFFDSTDLHGDDGEFESWQDPDQQDHFYPEGEFPNDEFEFDFAPADEIGLYDEVPGVTSSPEDFMDPYPEDESVKLPEQRMFDDDTDAADIFTNSTEEKFFSATAPSRVPEKSLSVDELESSLARPEDEIDIDWDDSKRMELEQVDKPKQPVPYDDYQATDAEWDALKGEQEYQAGLDDEREEREYQRSGGGRRADWEWQY